MLRAIITAPKAAVTTIFRVLERGWDGLWRWALSPLRALLGPAAPEPVDYEDANTERRLGRLIENAEAVEPTLPLAQAAAQHAALDAVENDALEPANEEWIKRRAREWVERREREDARGERIRAAMLASDLSHLDEAEAFVIAELDDYDFEDLVRMEKGVDITRRLDELVRGFAATAALHERLSREGRLDDPDARAPSPGM